MPTGMAKGRPEWPLTETSLPPPPLLSAAAGTCTVNASVSGARSAENASCACQPPPPPPLEARAMGDRMAMLAGALPCGTLPVG